MGNRTTAVAFDKISVKEFGDVWFAVGPKGIWRIEFDTSQLDFLERLYDDGVSISSGKRLTAPVRHSLAAYFAGRNRTFHLKVDWSRLEGFTRRALQVCARIPYGTVMSYGEIAARAGSPGGARAAGNAMGKNPFAIVVPCHRVINSDGSIGGYGGGLRFKRFLLRMEGIDLDKMRG